MRNKKNFLKIVLLIAVIHMIFFAKKAGPEHVFRKSFSFSIDAAASLAESDTSLAFVSNGYGGIFTESGQLLQAKQHGYGIAYTDDYYIPYNQVSDLLVVHSWKNEGQNGIIRASGYPFFIDAHLYILGPDARTLSEWTPDGRFLWEMYTNTPITAVAANATNTIVATLMGEVRTNETWLEENGMPVYALAHSGQYMFLIRGQERASLYMQGEETKGGYDDYQLIESIALKEQPRRRIPAYLRNDGRVIFAVADTLTVLHNGEKTASLQGDTVLHIAETEDAVLVLQQGITGERSLSAWSWELELLAIFAVPPDSDYFRVKDNRCYLAGASSLVSFVYAYE